MQKKLKSLENWKGMEVPADIPQGDMPSDPVTIGKEVTEKADILFPYVIKELEKLFEKQDKVVISICGGSGVGKTCIASLFTYYLNSHGIGAYTLSGDNYPRRIPEYNDAERLHTYRDSATRGLAKTSAYTSEVKALLKQIQTENNDSNTALFETYPWLEDYYNAGCEGLKGYLGTGNEIRFDELDAILKEFKEGVSTINLKRMGRDETSLWYDSKDFTNIQVLILEWTHGLSSELSQVDLPILLNSTPEETLEFRKARGRDAGADSPFVKMVLEIEQKKLHNQAKNAKLIMTRDNEMISYETYCEVMKGMD
ncbi:MAG: adenylylsulfate kinase [Holdemanella sp.]|nr:adenylylsulfate kinase [Holdemanella sp.]